LPNLPGFEYAQTQENWSVIDEMARQLGHELNGQDKLVIRTKTAMVLAAAAPPAHGSATLSVAKAR
jgi:hypothetical protein